LFFRRGFYSPDGLRRRNAFIREPAKEHLIPAGSENRFVDHVDFALFTLPEGEGMAPFPMLTQPTVSNLDPLYELY